MSCRRAPEWPGRRRRRPRPSQRDYLVLKPLASALEDLLESRLEPRTDLAVLDVGCGEKPYYPLIEPYASDYRGLDMVPGPYVDDIGSAQQMPYEDGRFDLVLCTQVLEHAVDPSRVIAEIHRVLRPRGVVLASTHGVEIYHPGPPGSGVGDFWRWTHAGLARLFQHSAAWADLEIRPTGETPACIGYLVAQMTDSALHRLGVPAIRAGAVTGLNLVFEALDRIYPAKLRTPAAGSLSANYVIAATKRAG
jgi:SAM-dependent methyltransferase